MRKLRLDDGWERGYRSEVVAACVLFIVGLVLSAGPALGQPYAYVANLGADSVSVIDTATQTVAATIAVGDDPDGVAVSPDGRAAYVSNFLSDNVTVIDTQGNQAVATIAVGTGPVGLAVTPDGAYVYVANRGSNTVSVIEVATRTVVDTIAVGSGPNAVAIAPDGAAAYVTNSFTKTPGTVSVIDTTAGRVTATVEVYRNPNRLVISPDGQVAYVANFRSWNVAVIDTASNTLIGAIPLTARPSGLAVHPNGATLYVVTLGGRVEIINTASREVTNLLAVGSGPYGIATTRDGAHAYVANFSSGMVSAIDLAEETSTADIVVGDRPFAVAVGCVDSGCTAPPYTPRPTRTPTETPSPGPTGTPTPTGLPTRTPTLMPSPARLTASTVVGHPGQRVSVAVSLDTAGRAVSGVQNDLIFDPRTRVAVGAHGRPDCAVNPAIDKPATGFAFVPTDCASAGDCQQMRAVVLSYENADPIPTGAVLYTCHVDIAPDAEPGSYLLAVEDVVASSPLGERVPVVGEAGRVDVALASGRPASARAPAASSGGGCQVTPARRDGRAWPFLGVLVLCGLACRARAPRRTRFLLAVVLLLPVSTTTSAQTTETPTPTPSAGPVQINLAMVAGGPGDAVPVAVSLDTGGAEVAATANDIAFDPRLLSLDPATCRVNGAIRKTLVASVVRSEDTRTTVRVLVQASQNASPIASGIMYTCTFRIAASALPGTYVLANDLALAISPTGAQVAGVVGGDGAVTVSLIGRACAGDCDGDGAVTINELVLGTNIALENRPAADCLALDRNGDALVTVAELVAAVNTALGGCFAPPTPVPSATPTPTPTAIRLFVRQSGLDTNTGVDPVNALRTITRAAQIAQSGYQIVVGPGTYSEGVTTSTTGRAPQALRFTADVSGSLTGDPAGVVLIDATGTPAGAGFKLTNVSGGVIEGFQITGSADAAIVLKTGSNHVTIQNCVLFNNPGDAIRSQDSTDLLVFNNLVYGNGGQGVGLVGQVTGSPAARVVSNTIYGNGGRALTVGSTRAASQGALLRNNIIQNNGLASTPPSQNIKVFTDPRSDLGYDADFNLVFPPSYLPATLVGAHDLAADAAFDFASGGDFHLRPESPAIDAGDPLPQTLEHTLFSRTTTGTGLDTGALDLGYHYLP